MSHVLTLERGMTSGHEIMSNILRVLEFGSPEFWPVVQQAASDQWPLWLTRQEPPYIDLGRSTEIDLVDGTKAPDKCQAGRADWKSFRLLCVRWAGRRCLIVWR